jgi:hypothetical protein
MPASSKAQQRFFGVVKAMQKGDKPKEGEAGKVAKSMKKKDVDDFASTKHKGKPEKVKREQRVKELIKKMVREELAQMNEKVTGQYKVSPKVQMHWGMDKVVIISGNKRVVLNRKEMKSLIKGVKANKLTEGKLNEKVQKYVVGLDNGEVISGDKAVSEKKAHQIMTRISDRSDGWVNPFMIGVEAWNGTHPKSKGKPHKMNKKKIMILSLSK